MQGATLHRSASLEHCPAKSCLLSLSHWGFLPLCCSRVLYSHDSLSSSLCAAVSLFLSASVNSKTVLPVAPPGCCVTLLLEREGGGSWERDGTAVLLCFSWMSFHSPSAEFSPRSKLLAFFRAHVSSQISRRRKRCRACRFAQERVIPRLRSYYNSLTTAIHFFRSFLKPQMLLWRQW